MEIYGNARTEIEATYSKAIRQVLPKPAVNKYRTDSIRSFSQLCKFYYLDGII